MTLVSIIVPVYNRADLLSRCLTSIEQQTFENWECLILDDGSTDSSVQIANSFSTRDARFHALARTRPRKGAAACRNEGIERSNGEYVVFLDSDDVMAKTCIAGRVDAFAKNASYDFIVFQMGGFFEVPGDSSIVWNIEKSEPDLLRYLRLDAPWSITGPLWNRPALLRIGGFDESLPGWQDWQVHIVALLEGLKYLRSGTTPDSFCRIVGADKIGGKASSLDHLKPKAQFVVQLLERYAARFKGDASLRNACVGLLWYLVVQLQENGCPREALSHWLRLRRLKFMGFRMWIEGLLALTLHGKRGGSLAWRFVASWPASIRESINRSTMLSVSADRNGCMPFARKS